MKTCNIIMTNPDGSVWWQEEVVLHAGAHFVVTYDAERDERGKRKTGYTVTHLRTGYGLVKGLAKKKAVLVCDVWNELFTRLRFDSRSRDDVRAFHKAAGILNADVDAALHLLCRKVIGEVNFDNGLCAVVELSKSAHGVEGIGDVH